MTNGNKTSQTETSSSKVTREGITWTVLGDLASARLATAVGSVIVLSCILGTLLPQRGDVQKYLAVHPGSESLMKFLYSLGLTNVFEAWWFIALLVFFCGNITACLIKRLSPRIKSGHMGIPGWGFLLTHISILLILGGAVIRGAIGQKGSLEIREGQTTRQFMTYKGPAEMPFAVHLVNFELEYYTDQPDRLSISWAEHSIQTQMVVKAGASAILHPQGEEPTASNSFKIVVSRYVPDFVVDMSTREINSRSEEPRNPAILVDISGPDTKISKWLFANFPDFDMTHSSSGKETSGKQPIMRYLSTSGARLRNDDTDSRRIKSFKSTLQLMENGKVVKEKTIEVNSPLSYRGYTLYQAGYNPADLTWSTMQVVCDPGVPVVYTGFLSMIAGMFLLLFFKPIARNETSGKQPPDQGGLSS